MKKYGKQKEKDSIFILVNSNKKAVANNRYNSFLMKA